MMDFNKFCEQVKEQILEVLPSDYQDSTVDVQKVTKNNDQVLTGITIRRPGVKIAPTIYLEGFYDRFSDGELSFEAALDEIASCRISAGDAVPESDFDVEKFTDLEYIRGRIIPRIVNKEMNKARLENLVSTDFTEDLAVVYAIDCTDKKVALDGSTATAAITNSLFDQLGITVEELDAIARKNIEGKSVFKSMFDVLTEMMGEGVISEEEGAPQMFVLTNESKINGANAMLDQAMMASIAERLGGDFTILPSSIHEVIVLPNGTGDDRDLADMVTDVNDTQVADRDLLSYHVYRYDSVEQKVVLAA